MPNDDQHWDLPIQPPIDPILAKLARTLPTPVTDDADGGWLFEPKWDGFRAVVFRDRDRIEIFSRSKKPLGRYFPELIEPLLAALPERAIIDGEIIVADRNDRGLDFDALLQRIHPAASRIERLSTETPALFVAFDVLALGDRSLIELPTRARRKELTDAVTVGDIVYVTPASTDRDQAAEWFDTFEGAGLDGVIAKPLDGTYELKKRALVKVKHQRSGIVAIPGFRIHKDGNGVGSLMCALATEDGHLHSVGVAASFSVARRAELLNELRPHAIDVAGGGDYAPHPWAEWITWMQQRRELVAAGKSTASFDRHAGASRWHAAAGGKDTSFIPLDTTLERGLVAEVTFGQLEAGRFRHGVSFVKWRPDVTPAECRRDQLDVADPVDVMTLLVPPT